MSYLYIYGRSPHFPDVTITQLVDDLVEKGAKLIIANSVDMQNDIREAARKHPVQVSNNYFNTDFDVVISGIAATEIPVVAKQVREKGKAVWAVPYDIEPLIFPAVAFSLKDDNSEGVSVNSISDLKTREFER